VPAVGIGLERHGGLPLRSRARPLVTLSHTARFGDPCNKVIVHSLPVSRRTAPGTIRAALTKASEGRLSRGMRPDIQPGTLIRRAVAHICVVVGAEHIDRARHCLVVGPLARHKDDAGLYLVPDAQHQSDGT
jgi:hypothetical protein